MPADSGGPSVTPAPAPAPQFDFDLHRELAAIRETVASTAAKVNGLHEALLGEHGHVGQILDHIERLYDRARELDGKLQASAQSSGLFRAGLSGSWRTVAIVGGVLLGLAELAHAAAALATFVRGH
jgi:hypothetical protein